MFELGFRVYFGHQLFTSMCHTSSPFNLFIFRHTHSLTRARHHRCHRTRPSKLLMQNLILYAGATKFHFSWPKMVAHKSRSKIDNLSRSTGPRGALLRSFSIPIHRPSHLGWPSNLTNLCEYASKLSILTTLHNMMLEYENSSFEQ